jgi:glycosyltransferase involved in cell wall biosynthesis/GT2 family glycosyltransferase
MTAQEGRNGMNTQVTEKISRVMARNRVKNNLLRKSYQATIISMDNISINADDRLIPVDPKKPMDITFQGSNPLNFLKLVYSFSSHDQMGNLEFLNEKGELLIEIGPFTPLSTPYFCKFPQGLQRFTLRFTYGHHFDINQLEFIEISQIEYKSKKLNQYRLKLQSLIRKQPHLKKRVIYELKKNGFKATWMKTKAKLYQNGGLTNIITVAKQEQITTPVSSKNGILVISHDAQRVGAPLLALNIAKSLREVYQQNVHVLLMKGGPNENEYSKYGTVYNLHQGSLSYVENETRLRELLVTLKENGVDKCIANTVVSGVLSKLLSEVGIRTVTLVHELPTSIKTYNFLEGAYNAANYSEKVVFPNSFVRDKFKEDFIIDDNKVIVRSQGIYSKTRLEMSKEVAKIKICELLNISHDSKIVLNCGYADLRKGTDLYFDIAKEIIVNCGMKDVHFVWLGDTDPILQKWLEHDMKVLGMENNFHFIGFVKDPQFVFLGADVFLLTSREDPFPTVVLEAMEFKTPVIAFEGAGGIPELLDRIGAKNVLYANTKLMALEALSILENPSSYKRIVEMGQNLIRTEYDHQEYVGFLLNLLEENTTLAQKKWNAVKKRNFKVSVIIPNYNYEKFIKQRLDTIIEQTYPPYEIIFLDDCSKDNSINVAREILSRSQIPFKVIENKTNVGCFGQWIKGIELAEGDLVWIAEADDMCELDLLERLVGSFTDQEVNLAYGQSQIINEFSESIDYKYTQYTDDLSTTKWLNEYSLNGREEVVQGLVIKNTIPNASAVVMRKSALAGLDQVLNNYYICGDWLTYLYALRIGKIAFCPQILNYHRRHSQSIISVKEQSTELYLELINIKKFIIDYFQIPFEIKDRFLNHIKSEYSRLGCKGFESRDIFENPALSNKYRELIEWTEQTIATYNYLQERTKLLFIAPDLEVGGGQMLVARLANHFAAFHDVYIYNARPWLVNDQIVEMLSPLIKLVSSSGDSSELDNLIVTEGIRVVNSHIWWSDKAAYHAVKQNPEVKWIISMHGCYEALLDDPGIDWEFESIVKKMFHRANHIIYATDKNRRIFEKVYVEEKKLHKVYYGYTLQSIPPKSKEQLGIGPNDFVFGLVSRAIPQKGWEESVEAVIELRKRHKHVQLILVGSGSYAEDLKEKYSDIPFIHFVTSFTEPSEWIGWVKIFDVGLLPSYFVSESLPNTIIEYLAYGKPVIATNIGDIKHMVINGKAEAGYVFELNEDRTVDSKRLMKYMDLMLSNSEEYEKFKKQVHILFEQFKMEKFATTYFEYFEILFKEGESIQT